MNCRKQKIRNHYLHNTSVENIFLSEYMPVAPGDYVKVYLFALMFAEASKTINNTGIAKQLGIPEEDVLKAWTYWEKRGLIKKTNVDSKNPMSYKVEFVNLKEQLFDKNGKKEEKEAPEFSDRELKELYLRIEKITGRMLDGKEPMMILSWIRDYAASPELIILAYQQSGNKRASYVNAVLKNWIDAGVDTVEKANEYIENTDKRKYKYKRVLRALGCHRGATEEEQRIMDSWFDDFNISLEQAIEACRKTSGITNPNINYVNAVLTGKKEKQIKPETKLDQAMDKVAWSYENDKKRNEAEAEKRRREVYEKHPRIKEIVDSLRKIEIEASLQTIRGTVKQEIIERRETLIKEKAILLTENNFPLDYLDVKYNCDLCSDTGMLKNGERCSCFVEKLEEQRRINEKDIDNRR